MNYSYFSKPLLDSLLKLLKLCCWYEALELHVTSGVRIHSVSQSQDWPAELTHSRACSFALDQHTYLKIFTKSPLKERLPVSSGYSLIVGCIACCFPYSIIFIMNPKSDTHPSLPQITYHSAPCLLVSNWKHESYSGSTPISQVKFQKSTKRVVYWPQIRTGMVFHCWQMKAGRGGWVSEEATSHLTFQLRISTAFLPEEGGLDGRRSLQHGYHVLVFDLNLWSSWMTVNWQHFEASSLAHQAHSSSCLPRKVSGRRPIASHPICDFGWWGEHAIRTQCFPKALYWSIKFKTYRCCGLQPRFSVNLHGN